jgi:hypothetical protein
MPGNAWTEVPAESRMALTYFVRSLGLLPERFQRLFHALLR